jgi:flagellar basal body-associated protein FliL
MTPETANDATPNAARSGLRWIHVVLIVLTSMAVAAGLTFWLVSYYLFPSPFDPVELKPREQQVLNDKLRVLRIDTADSGSLEPEPYSEAGARREIEFTERELNALLARNTDLAQRLAIDLADELVSAKLLIPFDEDFPVFGGRTLRVNAGMELAFRDGQPVVVLKGVSVMGVPVPNAWLGNLKNIDLVREFGGDQGFWKTFADGVDHVLVDDGHMVIKLKE